MSCTEKRKIPDKMGSLYLHIKIIYCVLIFNFIIYGVGIYVCISVYLARECSVLNNNESKVVSDQTLELSNSLKTDKETAGTGRLKRSYSSDWMKEEFTKTKV